MRENARTRLGTSLRGSIVLANAMNGLDDAVAVERGEVGRRRRRSSPKRVVIDAVMHDDDLARRFEARLQAVAPRR